MVPNIPVVVRGIALGVGVIFVVELCSSKSKVASPFTGMGAGWNVLISLISLMLWALISARQQKMVSVLSINFFIGVGFELKNCEIRYLQM